MAKKPRTPEEQRRIDERIAFVQAHPELSKEEARTRYYVQTRAAELEAQGKTVDRQALRQKFRTGQVTRAGFYTPGDVQAGARRLAALNATRTGTGGTPPSDTTPSTTTPSTVTAPSTGPLGGETKMVKGVPTRMGPETRSYVTTKPPAPPKEITPWQESWPNKQINTAITAVDKAAVKTGKFVGNTVMETAESFNRTFVNPVINVGGWIFGKNPNLPTSGPIEATTNVAGALLDIGTFGASRVARTGAELGIRAATPTVSRLVRNLLGETASRVGGTSARGIREQFAATTGRVAAQGVQRVVDRIPGGQKVKAAVSKIDEMMTPYQYRALREGVATIKPSTPGARGSWEGTRASRIRATEEIDAADILDFEPEDVTDLFGRRVGNDSTIVNKADDDWFWRKGFDIEETVEAPRYSADVTPADMEEVSKIDDWMRDAPKPTTPAASTSRQEAIDNFVGNVVPEPPPTQVFPETRPPRAPEPQTQRTAPPPTRTTPPPAQTTPPTMANLDVKPGGKVEIRNTGTAGAATPESGAQSLFGPEFEARRAAADAAAQRAAERSPNSRAARQNPQRRTNTRRADLTPEELEARQVETRARDAERKRLERARKAEERKAAKEAAKAADEAAQQAPTSGATNVLSETEQAREAAGQTQNPSWFVARRERQAQRAAEAAAAPPPQAAQEVVVSAREAVTEATQIPESQITSEQWWANAGGRGQQVPASNPAASILPQEPSAPVRPAPVQPTRAADTTGRGTGRQRPPVQQPAAQKPPTQTPAPSAPAPAPATGNPFDLSKITTQEQFDEFMNRGGRQMLNDMDINDFVATIKANPNVQPFLENNPLKRAAAQPSTGKVPGQMKAVSNEGTQTRFNRRGVAVPEELSAPMTFEPPVKPTSTKESGQLQKTIEALESQRKKLMELTDLRGGARTEVESANIDALQRQIDESRRVMLEFNQEYIAGVAPKARPVSATEQTRLERLNKQAEKARREGKPAPTPKETADVPEEAAGLNLGEPERRGTQRRTLDPDWEREVNPDDIDLFDEPSY